MNSDKRWLDFPAIFTLAAALLVAASRLSATKWTEDLGMVVSLSLIATALGAALGYSRFHHRLVALFGLVYTAFFIPWQLGLTIGGEATSWSERLQSLSGRISIAATQFFGNQPSSDSILFVASMALLFWGISLTAAYRLVRYGRPWQSLILAGITLVIVDIYSPAVPRSNFYSAAFILLALLLLTEIYFMKAKARWREKGVAVDSDIEFNLGRGALIAGLVLTLLAWNIPSLVLAFDPGSIEQQSLSEAWEDFRQRFENATAPLQGPLLLEQEYFGDSLSLGTGSPLTDELIFSVTPSLTSKPEGVAYYWRGRSYDFYDMQSGWDSSILARDPVEANAAPFPYPDYTDRVRVRFTINTRKNLGILYTPSLPLSVSRPASAVTGNAGEGTVDVLALFAQPPVRGGESYEVLSSVSAPTIADMRATGTEYPEWVTGKYLQLPSDFSPSIQALSDEITAGLETPYDKAYEVTRWLRENITYQQVINPVPAGKDPIEYFLFESRTGFCNYYATAEVLLLRAAGVPARMSAGYAEGEYNAETNTYQIRRKQIHAWPEVYFPGIGWVEFEPTASQPEIARALGSDPNNDSGDVVNPGGGNTRERAERDNMVEEQPLPGEQAPIETRRQSPWLLIGIAVALALIAIPVILYTVRRRNNQIEALPVLIEQSIGRRGWRIPFWIRRWSHLARLTPFERAFLTVEGVLSALRHPADPSATPAEAVDALGIVLPSGLPYAQQLLDEYQRATYSRYPADLDRARSASRDLIRVAGRAWLQRLFNGPQPVEMDSTD